MRDLFLFALLALALALHALLACRRLSRFRELAASLGARHVAAGWLAPGTIAGEDFEIEAKRVGKSYWTEVRVRAGRTPGNFHLRPAFFRAQPDWASARVPAAVRQRVFLWQVELPGYVEPNDEQRRSLGRWLNRRCLRADFADDLASAKVRDVIVTDEFVSIHCRGILQRRERARRVLDLLRQVVPEERDRGGQRAAA
jgi:hypothetical protein